MRPSQKITIQEYCAIHYYMRKSYGSASRCENPECTKISKNFDWALKKGCEYAKDRNVFMQLCKKCHRKMDMTEEDLARIRIASLGVKRTPEQIARLVKAKIGRHKMTDELREKIRDRLKRFQKPIVQLTDVGEVIKIWPSRNAAQNELGISNSSIRHAVRFERRAGGFRWRNITEDLLSTKN